MSNNSIKNAFGRMWQNVLARISALEQGGVGGVVQSIQTITGKPLKFFVGTQQEHDALTEEQQENLYAIITDDDAQEEVIESLGKLEEWKDQAKVYTKNFDDVSITKGTSLELGNLPSNRSLDEIVGVGLEVGFSTVSNGGHDETFRFSGGKTRPSSFNPTNGRYEVPFNLTVSTNSSLFEFKVVCMDVVLSSKDGKLYLDFDNGSFAVYEKQEILNSWDGSVYWLASGDFSLGYACYWFA